MSLFHFGCTKAKSVVVMDNWWAVDLAKSGCELRAAKGNPCVGEPVAEVRDFMTELNRTLADDESCRGVAFKAYNDHLNRTSQAASEADWQLMLDFTVGQESQLWSLVPRRGDPVLTTGQGNPREIAHSICKAVNYRGGFIFNKPLKSSF